MSKVSTAQKLQLVALSVALASIGTINKSDAQGSHRTFNVKTFGAAGDGTTDDTAAIQSAFTAAQNTGSTVVFPAGTYLISATINGSGVAVVGTSATITTASNGVTELLLRGTSPSVTGMAFAASAGTNALGIEVINATNANVTSNVFGANLADGIIYDIVTGGTITSNNLQAFTGTVGIAVASSSGITVTKNAVTQNLAVNSAGIIEANGQNDVIQGNAVTWTTANTNSFGIISQTSTSPQIIKNTVVGGNEGIEVLGGTTALVDHNVVSGSVDCGILDTTNTNDTISNNTINNNANDAIRVTGGSGAKVTTNAIDGAGGNGVMTTGGNISITNNAIGDCALTVKINAVIHVNNTKATSITVTGNQYKGNTTNVTDFIHVLQTTASVSGNKTNSLLPTVVGP